MKDEQGTWTWRQTVVVVALAIVLAAAVWVWGEPLWALLADQARLRAWVTSFGPWGPLVTIALNVAQVLLAPVPGQFVGLVNGYLYGVWLGTLYSMVGLLLGTALAMGLGRRFGRPLVERLVSAKQLARWDGIADRQGPVFFFLVFLFPFVPDDVACFLIGLSSLSIPTMLVVATPARLPGVLFSCWLGAYGATLPLWAWLPLGGGAAALVWVYLRYQGRMEAAVVGLIRRLVGKDAGDGPMEGA